MAVFFEAAHLACSLQLWGQSLICLPMTWQRRWKYLLASCSMSPSQYSTSSRGESARWYTDFYSTAGRRPGSPQAGRGGGNGLRVKPFQQCSLQGKIAKYWSPLPPDFSISTTLYTVFKSASGTAVWQCEGKRSRHIISSVVGYLSACPVRNLSRPWAMPSQRSFITHTHKEPWILQRGCSEIIWELEDSAGTYTTSGYWF